MRDLPVSQHTGRHTAVSHTVGDRAAPIIHHFPPPMSAKAYAQAGVDIALADRLLTKVKPVLKTARRPESVGSIGGFGGLFDISKLAKR